MPDDRSPGAGPDERDLVTRSVMDELAIPAGSVSERHVTRSKHNRSPLADGRLIE